MKSVDLAYVLLAIYLLIIGTVIAGSNPWTTQDHSQQPWECVNQDKCIALEIERST